MSGPNVIIVDSGGVPVRPVDDNAPILTVSENDFGVPITLTELGAPFVIQGLVPPIDWNWQPFTMTSGDSGEWIGYSNGDIAYPPFNPPVGMISGQPTAVTDLVALFQDQGSGDIVAVFHGSYGEQLQLLEISLGGFVLMPSGFSEMGGNTWLRFSGLPGDLNAGETYEVMFGWDLDVWTPAALFGLGQPGHWPGGYDPDAGRLWQDAAGITLVNAAGQPVGRTARAAGSVDASQATALSRPTLGRWPKGGRRNIVPSSDNMTLWVQDSGAQANGSVVTATTLNQAASIRLPIFSAPIANMVIYGEVEALNPIAAGGESVCFGVFNAAGTYRRVEFNLVTGVASGQNSTNFLEALENVQIGVNKRRIAIRTFGEDYTRMALFLGPFNSTLAPGRSFAFTNMSVELGDAISPLQKVVSQYDISEAGKPDVWHLSNDGGDSLMLDSGLPAGAYGCAWVDAYGVVTIDTTAGVPVNALRPTAAGSTQVDIILRQGAFTADEEASIRAYWAERFAA